MPSTPPSNPPSLPSTPPPLSTPLTSPQRSQQAARHQERNQRTMGSPEQRRTPTAPPFPMAPIPQGQRYTHLPPALAAQLAALPPMPQPTRRHLRHSTSLAAVSFTYLFIYESSLS